MACSLRGERGFSAILLPRGFGLLRGACLSAAVAVQNPDGFCFRKYKSVPMIFFIFQKHSPMTDTPSPRPSRSALSPAARALRLQRIFARLQDGAGYADIAAEEGFSRERLRQIVRAATAPAAADGRTTSGCSARLTPALRLAADGVARGDAKSIPLLLQIIDRLDRYSDPLAHFSSPELFVERRRPPSAKRRKPAGTKTAGDALGRSAAKRPKSRRQASKGLKTLKTARG